MAIRWTGQATPGDRVAEQKLSLAHGACHMDTVLGRVEAFRQQSRVADDGIAGRHGPRSDCFVMALESLRE